MADVTATFASLSSTESSNAPAGSTAVGTGLDDNLRMMQAHIAAFRDATGRAGLAISSMAGTNTLTGSIPARGSITMTPTAYSTGDRYYFVAANTNTGATTINIDSLGAKNIFWNGQACVGGEIRANMPVFLEYDGTQFHICGNGFNAPFLDTHAVVEGSADSTKKVRFEVDGLTTATTRVITVSDKDITLGKAPTRQTFTSGSGTYSTPAGCTLVYIRMIGGGGGGSGSGASATNGSNGGDTTFSTLTAAGGTGGNGSGTDGAGGAGTNGDINITGQSGHKTVSSTNNTLGGRGGSSMMGFGGAGGGLAGAGEAGIGYGGGGGGGGVGSSTPAGGGGGAGAYVEKIISAPSASYAYAVGASGSGGAAGTAGGDGGAGAAGIITVLEYYD